MTPQFPICIKKWLDLGSRCAALRPINKWLNSLHFNGHFSNWTWVSWYQNLSILDFVGAKGDGGGGGNWSYKEMCKDPVK